MAGLEGSDALQRKLIALQNGTATKMILGQLGNEVVSRAKQNVPTATFNLHRTIRVDEVDEQRQTVRVTAGGTGRRGANQYGTHTTSLVGYAQYVEFGTGIYGPRGRPIVPVRGKFLRFPAKGSATRKSGNLTSAQQKAGGGFVFVKSVKGMRPRPYLIPAAEEVIRSYRLAPTVVKVWNDAS